MTQPLGFEEHPIITLEWTISVLEKLGSEARKTLHWQVATYEFSSGNPVEITPELHSFVLADKIAIAYDFYHASAFLFKNEESNFERLAEKALFHCSGLISTVTTSAKDGGRHFDDRFTWLMVEAFPNCGSVTPQDQVDVVLNALSRIEGVLRGKLAQFEEAGPAGGSMQRAKQFARQQILKIFEDCWIIKRADGSCEPAKIPSVFLRFADPVWQKITDQHLAPGSLARAYREGIAEGDSALPRHGLASTELLRAEARRLAEKDTRRKSAG